MMYRSLQDILAHDDGYKLQTGFPVWFRICEKQMNKAMRQLHGTVPRYGLAALHNQTHLLAREREEGEDR
jgi:hypothetical protein